MVGALISVDEYLHTMYHPDCDYMPLAEIFAALDQR
jgi:hypothetical protein